MVDLTPSEVEVEGKAVQTMGAHGVLVDVGVGVLADRAVAAVDLAILDLVAQAVDLVTPDLAVLVVEDSVTQGLAGQVEVEVEVEDLVTQDLAGQVVVEDSVTQGLVSQVVVDLVLVVLVDLVILVQVDLVAVLVILAQVVLVVLATRTHDRLLEVS